jgi:hypothetical protein
LDPGELAIAQHKTQGKLLIELDLTGCAPPPNRGPSPNRRIIERLAARVEGYVSYAALEYGSEAGRVAGKDEHHPV